jgi:hypothetical protein
LSPWKTQTQPVKSFTCSFVLSLVCSFYCNPVFSGEVGISSHQNFDDIIFSGQIMKGDAEKVKIFINELMPNPHKHRFIIHSPGGNVTEAMKIGELLRKNYFSIYEPNGITCISACVLVIMGGTIREVNGRVGLHHPLFLNTPITADTQKLLLEGEQAMVQYATRMNINPQIIRDMYTLKDESKIKYLSRAEIIAYHLSTEGE